MTLKLILQLPISLHGNYMLQSWPIFSGAMLGKKYDFLTSEFNKKRRYTIIYGIVVSTLFFLLAEPVVSVWSQGEIILSKTLILGFSGLAFIYVFSALYATFAFSQNHVAPFAFLGIITLPLMYAIGFLGVWFDLGPVSIILANIFMQLIGLIISRRYYKSRIIK